jgi:PAS domain S-box-containing protein
MAQRYTRHDPIGEYPYWPPAGRKLWLSYLVAVLATLAAALVTRSLPDYSTSPSFFSFLGAIAFSTWYGGPLPGAASLLLSIMGVAYITLNVPGAAGFTPEHLFIRFLAWVVVAVLIWYITAALQRARDEVQRSHLRFGGVVQISEDAIICVNERQQITLFNPGAEKIFGYSAQEAVGQPLSILLPPQVEALHAQHVRNFAGSPDVLRPMNERGPISGRRKSGEEFPAEASISKFEMRGEKILTVRLRDITERQKAEEGLRKLAAIVESSHDAIMGKTLDGVITNWNQGAQRIYGYTAAEAIGKNISMLVPADRQDELARLLESLRRAESVDDFETVRVRKDGQRIDVSLTISLIRNSAGEVVGASTIAREISDRKRAEREIENSLSILRATLESTADGILVVDREARIVTYNRKFAQMWRIPESLDAVRDHRQAVDYVVDQLKEPDKFIAKIHDLYSRPEAESYDLVEFKDGRVFERYSQPQRIAGEIVGRVWSYRDVSERKRLEQQLRQAQKMEAVGRLAGGIAHDFNNLLNVIIGYTYLLQSRLKPGDPLRANVEQVVQAADRATALTRQLLAFSRKQVLQLEVLDVNDVVAGMGKMLPRLIGEDIDLRIVAETPLGCIKADPGQIEQVIMNLVINARDAMPAGGKLTIETSNVYLDENYARQHAIAPGHYVMLAVSDTGHGMDAETRARIFEPFFTTKESGKGTGLGLATVYGIVSQSGGHIWVYSEVGHGTTFKIYLPRAEEPAREHHPALVVEPAGPGSETILLVEDEASMRKLLVEVLQHKGYNVLAAEDGARALEISRKYTGIIHLLITDVVMPAMRGEQLAEQLKQERPETRVMFMSGYTDKALAHSGVLQEDTILLQKPFTPDVLLRRVRQLLGPRAEMKKAS